MRNLEDEQYLTGNTGTFLESVDPEDLDVDTDVIDVDNPDESVTKYI